MESEFRSVLTSSCRSVARAVEKYEEEKSPSSMDSLLFQANQLYRLLLASCGDGQLPILEQVGQSISLLNEIVDSMEGFNHTGYTAPSFHTRGRPRFDIHREQIEHLLNLHFTCPKIASLLGVSLRTIRRRMTEYNLSVSGLYSDISEHELLETVKGIYNSFPNCGYRMMDGHLRQRGIRVTQAQIRNCMHLVDSEGVALRWREAIRRRKYRVAGPLSLWHIDGNHKLIRYEICLLRHAEISVV